MEKVRNYKKLGTAQKCVYDALKKEESEVSLISEKCGCGMSEIQVRAAVQLLIYKNLVYWDNNIPRVK